MPVKFEAEIQSKIFLDSILLDLYFKLGGEWEEFL